jgi:hypothetical protein
VRPGLAPLHRDRRASWPGLGQKCAPGSLRIIVWRGRSRLGVAGSVARVFEWLADRIGADALLAVIVIALIAAITGVWYVGIPAACIVLIVAWRRGARAR